MMFAEKTSQLSNIIILRITALDDANGSANGCLPAADCS